jgi:hypothetical protein
LLPAPEKAAIIERLLAEHWQRLSLVERLKFFPKA